MLNDKKLLRRAIELERFFNAMILRFNNQLGVDIGSGFVYKPTLKEIVDYMERELKKKNSKNDAEITMDELKEMRHEM